MLGREGGGGGGLCRPYYLAGHLLRVRVRVRVRARVRVSGQLLRVARRAGGCAAALALRWRVWL